MKTIDKEITPLHQIFSNINDTAFLQNIKTQFEDKCHRKWNPRCWKFIIATFLERFSKWIKVHRIRF